MLRQMARGFSALCPFLHTFFHLSHSFNFCFSTLFFSVRYSIIFSTVFNFITFCICMHKDNFHISLICFVLFCMRSHCHTSIHVTRGIVFKCQHSALKSLALIWPMTFAHIFFFSLSFSYTIYILLGSVLCALPNHTQTHEKNNFDFVYD